MIKGTARVVASLGAKQAFCEQFVAEKCLQKVKFENRRAKDQVR